MRSPALPILHWFAIGCIASFLTLSSHCAESRPSADAAKWEALVQKKLSQPPPEEGSVICVGSSHMAKWITLEEDLAPLRTYNMGIGGSRMRHAAELFIPRLVLPFKPRAVLLYEGSNDLAAGVQPAEILKSFQSLYQQLHEVLPKTRLYVLGVVPSPGKRFERWDAIVELNHLLESECAQNPWMRFLDTTSALLDKEGKPRLECFIPNDIHMTPAGYEVWKSVIAPVLIPAERAFESAQTVAP
jgi:lysophospholipase L1-like esterase